MEIFLSVGDVFRFAIRIEENGESFYRKAAQLAKDSKIKSLFEHLANEEINHKKSFEGMLSKIGEQTPHETYEGEYFAYLKDYIDRKVVFDEAPEHENTPYLRDSISAVEFAIQRELDSIMYYQEIKPLIQEKHHAEIEHIIKEERRHFLKLSETKRLIDSK